MSKAQVKPPQEMKYEEAFQELKDLVEKMESSELELEESLTLFERGQALAAKCSQLLEKAELRLRQLSSDEAGGFEETELSIDEE
jgi:exodeoxyribonuclease VII small subunit